MGDQPRVELFARQKTPGRAVWGNEVNCTLTMPERKMCIRDRTNIGNLTRDIKAATSLMQAIRQMVRHLKGWIADLKEKKAALLEACLLYTSRCV